MFSVVVEELKDAYDIFCACCRDNELETELCARAAFRAMVLLLMKP